MNKVKDNEVLTLKGTKYLIPLLSTTQGLVMSQQVAQLMLPSAGAALDGALQESVWSDKQTFAEMAILLTQRLGELELKNIVVELLDGVTADGIAIDFDTYFKGNYDTLLAVLEAALKANFGSLFMMTDWIERLKKFMTELSPPLPATQDDQGASTTP